MKDEQEKTVTIVREDGERVTVPVSKIKAFQFIKAIDIGRNDPCSCGSGKKFKRCCLDKTTKVYKRITYLKP